MSRKVLAMREIKKIIKLKIEDNYSQYAIEKLTGISRTTIRDYLLRFNAANLAWPLPDNITEQKLHDILFSSKKGSNKHKQHPDWPLIHQELKKKGVTLQLLWIEYKRENPEGMQYSWFANLYRTWSKQCNVWMVQPHKAGKEAFVDYSGLTCDIWDKPQQNQLYKAEIFVGVLGGSDLIFCHATPDQKLPSWILSHCLMLEYFVGVPELIVPDNLRSGVTKAHRYEPDCNNTYEDFATHYGCNICPARSRKPKDKAKVEKSVQTIQRQILAPKRNNRFTSMSELNEYIRKKVEEINNKPLQKLPYSRRALFNKTEKSELKDLPKQRYELATWFKETVNGGYHIRIYNHCYSIPYNYSYKTVESRVTNNFVECFHKDKRIASHKRDDTPGTYSTLIEHMPEAHRQQAQWNQENLTSWASSVGNKTKQLVEMVFANKHRHIKQKVRSVIGILRLSHAYSEKRLESACGHALTIGAYSYRSLESILRKGLDTQVSSTQTLSKKKTAKVIYHENIRGNQTYH